MEGLKLIKMLIKVWTNYWDRIVRAAGAELVGSTYNVEAKTTQANSHMAKDGARFFKVISEKGAFVGYFIYVNGVVPMQFTRDHMRSTFQSDFAKLILETQTTGLNFSIQRSNFNNKL